MLNKIKKVTANITWTHIFLMGTFTLFVTYLSYPCFRLFLKNKEIDPNFIVGFLTAIALILSLIQGRKDKQYSYGLLVISSMEERGLEVIAKLLQIKNNSELILLNAKNCIQAFQARMVFKDVNDFLSGEKLNSDMDIAAAYIDVYFDDLKEEWNILIDNMRTVHTISQRILINYKENISVVNEPGFKNSFLDNPGGDLREAEEIVKSIEEISLKIRNKIVLKINELKALVKDSI